VSIGRGAAPSGPLTSGRAVAVSRRCGAAPAYALRDSGLASRRRESDGGGAPSLPSGNEGASRHGASAPFMSIGRGAAPSGPLTSGRAVAVSRRWGRLKPMRFATPAWQAAAGSRTPDFFMRMGHGRLGPRGDRSPCSQPAHSNQNTAHRQCPTRRAYGSERRAVSPSLNPNIKLAA